ncbi:uncharacterized protein LOC114304356 [Camellia sinensis]|uniref:uncharacterized protein LOC114304356 n=1 Tax=Camellia sinensis TaxID=4442 RepID=UPI0010362F68|nr:uncharacterized protein LOC114304356 [Camellia sinensis]
MILLKFPLFIKHMHSAFSMKELESLFYFPEIAVHHIVLGLFLSQYKYASDILAKAGMLNCKAYNSSMATKSSSSSETSVAFSQPSLYCSIVGALQYLTLTQPDLSYAVNCACQFMHASTVTHFNVVKQLLRYLQGTLSYGLVFTPGPLTLHAYSDSNWAGSVLDRKYTTGYCVFLGPNLISWATKKQCTVSRSSTQAKYCTLAHTISELTWLRMLLREIHVPSISPPLLWCDNLSAISLASNPVFHARSKLIDVDYHFIRDQVMAKQVVVKHVSSSDQVADILTKPLPDARFSFLQDKLMVRPSPICLRGPDEIHTKTDQIKLIEHCNKGEEEV